MSRTNLLDVNVLIALLWPAHAHHQAAQRWFAMRRKSRWATCPLTQLAFVRIVSNPDFSSEALTPRNAMTLLRENLTNSQHEFWPDALSLEDDAFESPKPLGGHKQLTDLYLLTLASRQESGRLASFDGGLAQFASEARLDIVELVPTDIH